MERIPIFIKYRCQFIAEKIQKRYINKFPFYLVNLIKEMNKNGYDIDIYENNELPDGVCGMVTPIVGGCKIINVNKNQIMTRKRFTVAHELGHIVLGHCEKSIALFDKLGIETQSVLPEDRQANIFASELLMPKNIIKRLHYMHYITNSKELSLYFKVSLQAAMIRFKELNLD